jgi:hypothetical protein
VDGFRIWRPEEDGQVHKKILLLGGGDLYKYGIDFYEVGSHDTSDFGKGKNWEKIEFWRELYEQLKNKNYDKNKFKALMFEEGSECWFKEISKNKEFYDVLSLILKEYIDEDGLMLITGRTSDGHYRAQILEQIDKNYKKTFNKIGAFVLHGTCGEFTDIFSIKKKNIDDTKLANYKQGIYNPYIKIGEKKSDSCYFIYNPGYGPVSENNLLEFVKNRILQK